MVIHGIPSKKVIIKDGDIVSIDVGAYIGGFHGDTAATVGVGNVPENALRLMEVTRPRLKKPLRSCAPSFGSVILAALSRATARASDTALCVTL